MAAKFKMANKTEFSYVAKQTLVRLKTFGQFNLDWKKKNWKLQNQKWPLHSRWPPKFDLLLKSKNRLIYRNKIFF
jgi:hypothetical protein